MLDQSYVIFDLETTGLSREQDAIIQIAAVKLVNGRMQPADTFFSYVNPGMPISSWISQYTGITDAHVRKAPGIAEVLPQFSSYAGDSILVAHNGHRFDMPFLKNACQKQQLPVRPIRYLDSIALSWLTWGRKGLRHGMDAIIARLELSLPDARRHDARGDALLLAMAIEVMIPRILEKQPTVELKYYQGVLPATSQSLPNEAIAT